MALTDSRERSREAAKQFSPALQQLAEKCSLYPVLKGRGFKPRR